MGRERRAGQELDADGLQLVQAVLNAQASGVFAKPRSAALNFTRAELDKRTPAATGLASRSRRRCRNPRSVSANELLPLRQIDPPQTGLPKLFHVEVCGGHARSFRRGEGLIEIGLGLVGLSTTGPRDSRSDHGRTQGDRSGNTENDELTGHLVAPWGLTVSPTLDGKGSTGRPIRNINAVTALTPKCAAAAERGQEARLEASGDTKFEWGAFWV
jgi:hypothetical protein